MTYLIPNETKKIIQTNESDLSGHLFATKNIDLRNNGYIKLSHLPVALFTEDNDARFDVADAMFKGRQIYINSDDLFSGNAEWGGTWTNRSSDTNAPTPAVEDDGIYFNGVEVVTDVDDIYYNSTGDANTWTILDIDTVAPVQVAILDTFNSLLVGASNFVKMIDTSWVVTKTLTLPIDYAVTALATNGNTVYIGTRHNESGEGKLFTWDGVSSAWNNSFGVDAVEISTIRKYGASCALVTSKGQLLQFNGSSFTVLGNLPVFYDKDNTEWEDALNDHDKISNRGMYVDGEKIYFKLTFDEGIDFNPNRPHGVWCYTPENGLFCLNTASYNRITDKMITNTNINTTDNTITTTGVPITGTPVRYEAFADVIGGLSEYETYYTIKISDTIFKLATTYQNALDGIAIDLTSQGGAYPHFYFMSYYDYGQTLTNDRGAILVLPDTLVITYQGKKPLDNLLYTADLKLPAKTVLNSTSSAFLNRGYFITPKLNSSSIEDNYNTISIKHRPLRAEEKIIVKYRTVEKLDVPFGSFTKGQTVVGTWTDTNTFTTTLDMTNAEVGDEIEIVAGKGAGMLFHIESLSNNTGTWTVNLDESFNYATASETMYFYVSNYKKLETITKDNTDGIDYLSVSLDKNSKFLQLKIELRGVDVTIEELQVINKEFQS